MKCAFKNSIISNGYECDCANGVSTRNGPDILCGTEESSQRCQLLFDQFKDVALLAMGLEDDLLSMPASALVKIQLGGLTGLQQQLNTELSPQENINKYLSQQSVISEGWKNISFDDIANVIQNFKLKQRRKK